MPGRNLSLLFKVHFFQNSDKYKFGFGNMTAYTQHLGD